MAMTRRAQGVTLIELMVVLAILAVLLAAGLPYTRGWVESNRQMQARNMLDEAVAHTRALALRNPGGVGIDDNTKAAARFTIAADTRVVNVYVADAAGAPAWTVTLPAQAQVAGVDAAGGTLVNAVACVAFDNRGRRLFSATDCLTPTKMNRAAITLGDGDPLYVDLL